MKRSQLGENMEKRKGKKWRKRVLLKRENGNLFNCPIFVTDVVFSWG
jgi:hypothetical protein